MSRTKLVIRSSIWPLLVGACLFASAGRLAIPAFWLYVAIFGAYTIYMGATMDLELAEERNRHKNARVLSLLIVAAAHWIIAGLDVGRYHWSPALPVWVQAAGLATCALSWVLSGWAMHTNSFFSSVIRIQKDRGQRVIDTGPYAWIRHPGYAAGLLAGVTSGFALGSFRLNGGSDPAAARRLHPFAGRGADASGGTAGIHGVRHAGALPPRARPLVGATGRTCGRRACGRCGGRRRRLPGCV